MTTPTGLQEMIIDRLKGFLSRESTASWPTRYTWLVGREAESSLFLARVIHGLKIYHSIKYNSNHSSLYLRTAGYQRLSPVQKSWNGGGAPPGKKVACRLHDLSITKLRLRQWSFRFGNQFDSQWIVIRKFVAYWLCIN